MKNKISTLIILTFVIIGCKKDPEATKDVNINPFDTITQYNGLLFSNSGKLQFQINYFFDSSSLQIGSTQYITAGNDTLTIENLSYYLTNITLTKSDGSLINLGNYNLINAEDVQKNNITLNNIPAGNYTNISFLIGVDSLKNHSGVQSGDLDPAYGMFWTWNTGYIFFRINGRLASGNSYSFDLGGVQNLVKINLPLSNFKVKSVEPKIYLNMNVAEAFKNPNIYSFTSDAINIHSATHPSAPKLAANLADVFSIESIVMP